MEYNVTHNASENRFEILHNDKTAYLSYEKTKDGLALTHTIVPDEIGGKGIGSYLVKHVLDYAKDKDLKVRPDCSFVAHYISEHSEYKDLSI